MATTILQFSSRTVHRFNHLPSHSPYFLSIQILQTNHFAVSRQRPRSIISLSNPNRKRLKETSDDTDTSINGTYVPSTDWDAYDVSLYQYFHDPRASQFRTILDYFKIPYDCIEVTPFKKVELSTMQIPPQYHHSPLLRMIHRKKLAETIDKYKNEAVLYIPKGLRSETLKIANVGTFKERIIEHINKHKDKSQEEIDNYKHKVDELYHKYDEICWSRYNLVFHHDDLHGKFLPFVKANLSNDQQRRIFNEKCDDEKVEFYATKYAWTLQACIAKSFHSCFQLMSYVKMFRKMRKWTRFQVESAHLFGGIKMRVMHRRRYCKRAQTGNQPKGQAMKLTYEFLQTFNEDMPDLNERQKLKKPKKNVEGEQVENTKQDIGLIGKPFHGGRNPDIMDLLVYGALRGVRGLDVYDFLLRRITQTDEWCTRMQDEVGKSACKQHI
eukprot:CAMPEP_0197035856 /NCGR_PEP_ID=MMETSP1384-20130603/13529_1 /TAXON_ID=29189 /ORGANISM="Ammonia sp." /LENGTH=439 /DNA_ID=CAMNT_0042465959 /DNA_START=47 /DNA_END=1366 /DNA_ORIENTATION=+